MITIYQNILEFIHTPARLPYFILIQKNQSYRIQKTNL